jgi:hypothetical protein
MQDAAVGGQAAAVAVAAVARADDAPAVVDVGQEVPRLGRGSSPGAPPLACLEEADGSEYGQGIPTFSRKVTLTPIDGVIATRR